MHKLRTLRRFVAALLTAASMAISSTAMSFTVDTSGSAITGLWYNAAESGWGVNVVQQYDIMFVTMFVYDSAGNPTWYVASNCAVSGAGCSGTLYRTAGGQSPTATWVGPITAPSVGTVTLAFSDVNTGTLSYSINGASGTKAIVRQVWRTGPTPRAEAEGFWHGILGGGSSSGVSGWSIAVLENGEIWAMETFDATTIVQTVDVRIFGAFHGVADISGSTMTGPATVFNDYPSRYITQSTFSGQFESKRSIMVYALAVGTFFGSYDISYDQPATLSSITGTYSGTAVTGSDVYSQTAITIDSGGTVSGTTAACTTTGRVTPRASGKNIFDVALAFSGTACPGGNGSSFSGIGAGIGYSGADGRTLLIWTLNTSKTDGFLFKGWRL